MTVSSFHYINDKYSNFNLININTTSASTISSPKYNRAKSCELQPSGQTNPDEPKSRASSQPYLFNTTSSKLHTYSFNSTNSTPADVKASPSTSGADAGTSSQHAEPLRGQNGRYKKISQSPTFADSSAKTQGEKSSALPEVTKPDRKRKRPTEKIEQHTSVPSSETELNDNFDTAPGPSKKIKGNGPTLASEKKPPRKKKTAPKKAPVIPAGTSLAAKEVSKTHIKEKTSSNGVESNDPGKKVKGKRRAPPGRRRKPNPDQRIEADIRRLTQIKASYKAVAKALKPVLSELAQRTINQVHDDPDAHKRSDNIEIVNKGLDARLHQRLEYLQTKQSFDTENMQKILAADQAVVHKQYAVSCLLVFLICC